eukprot:3433500-Prymnesium_polylepis.1
MAIAIHVFTNAVGRALAPWLQLSCSSEDAARSGWPRTDHGSSRAANDGAGPPLRRRSRRVGSSALLLATAVVALASSARS